MIGTIVTGRGNSRLVIERPRNLIFSQALSASIKKYLGISEAREGWGGTRKPKQRRAKRVSVTQ